jgi:hypothetical protein
MSADASKTEVEDELGKSAQRLYDLSIPPTQTPM